MSRLVSQKYGKDNVRVVKVSVQQDKHIIKEYNVKVLLFGPLFEESYTKGDNSLVVPTDTVKNTIYYLAYKHDLETIESFASFIISHFLSTYAHVFGVDVEIRESFWSRMPTTTNQPLENGFPGSLLPSNVNAQANLEHSHSFIRGGDERYSTHIVGIRQSPTTMLLKSIQSRLYGLTVLKSTGSSFTGFHKCPLTTLPEMKDRILSTTIDCSWSWPQKELSLFAPFPFDPKKAYRVMKQLILDIFANHDSPSVQNTLYLMCNEALKLLEQVDKISVSLPNSHVFVYDLERFGIKENAKGKGGIYYPVADPNGLITATVDRINKSRLYLFRFLSSLSSK